MSNWFKVLIIISAIIVFGTQCGKNKDENIYYRVGNSEITRDDVDRFWMSLPEQMKIEYMDKKGRQELLSKLVDLELLYQEALRQKLDQDPMIKFELDRTRKNILIEKLMQKELNRDDIYLYYQNNFARLDAITFSSQAQANATYQLLAKGADFKSLKARINPSQKDQELGYISRDDLIEQYGTEAAAQVFSSGRKEKFTPVVKTSQGWVIFYVLEEPGSLDPRGENLVMDKIIAVKQEEVFRGMINDLRNRIPVKANQENIDAFLKVGEDWEKKQMAQDKEQTATESIKTEQGNTAPVPGQTVKPVPGTTPE